MIAKQVRIEVQRLIGGLVADGVFGPKTRAAFERLALAPDGSEWPPTRIELPSAVPLPWKAYIDGADIVIENARVTCFGGSNDPQDSGDTASGVKTKGNPGLKACALPLNYMGSHGPTRKALKGSPLPSGIPWQTLVRFTSGSVSITVPVIDLGPALYTGNAGDLTIAAAKEFNPNASATSFEMRADIRIIGAARFAVDEPEIPESAVTRVDERSEKNIATLHRDVQTLARSLVNASKDQGITIRVTSGTRTYAEQDALFKQRNDGRDNDGDGRVDESDENVTGARGGQSNHNFGLAFDITIFNGSDPVWESPSYKKVGEIGKSLGLEWGGDWESRIDEPHFQLRPAWARGLSEKDLMAQLRHRHDAGTDMVA